MLLSGVKFLIGGVTALLIWSVGSVNSNNTFTAYNLILIMLLVCGGLTYLVLQVRDFKPNSRLRRDNAELRKDLDDTQRRLDTAEHENTLLKRSRDFEQALAGAIKAIGDSRAEAAAEHTAILSAIHETTEAVRLLAEAPERRRST